MLGKHFEHEQEALEVLEQIGEHFPGGFFIYQADEKEQLLYANNFVFDIFGCESLDSFKALTGFTFRGMVKVFPNRLSDSSGREMMNLTMLNTA